MFSPHVRVALAALVAVSGLVVSRSAAAETRVATSTGAMITEQAPAITEEAPALTSHLPPAPRRHRHALYVELLGKGGPYGLGYDRELRGWLGVGAVAAFARLDGQGMYSLTPYVTLYPAARGRHRWFVDAGPQLTHLVTPSPVPEWNGTSSTGVAGELSTGYEYRGPLFVRAYGMVIGGRNGFAPWTGLSVGFTR